MASAGKWVGKTTNVAWADVDNDDDTVGDLKQFSSSAAPSASQSGSSPSNSTSGVPTASSKLDVKTGIKTIVEYGTNAAGEKIKITRKVKV